MTKKRINYFVHFHPLEPIGPHWSPLEPIWLKKMNHLAVTYLGFTYPLVGAHQISFVQL